MATGDRRDIRGGAVQTTLSGGITNASTSCTITASTGWPDGATYAAFYIVVDPGVVGVEEKILCSTRSSLTVNFTTRGADGTAAIAHSSGAVVYPCTTAVDLDEANQMAAKYLKLATTVGQVPVVDAANSVAMVQGKASGTFLGGNATTVVAQTMSGDATLNGAGAITIATGAITSAKILDGTIATGDIAANAVTNALLAGMTRGTTKVGNSTGAASDLAVGTASQFLATDGTDVLYRTMSGDGTLSAGALTIAANAVTNAKLAAMIRGTVKIGNSAGAASDLTLGTTGKVFQSDGTDAKWNAFSGDVTVDGTGATAIGSGKITQAMHATGYRAHYEGTSSPSSPSAGDTWYDTTNHYLNIYNGTAWIATGTVVRASDTTTQTGSLGADFVYTTADIALTVGTWRICAGASLNTTDATDYIAVGIYGQTDSAAVANSLGGGGTTQATNSTLNVSLLSQPVYVTLASTKHYRVGCYRGGASTLQTSSVAGAPAAWIQGELIRP